MQQTPTYRERSRDFLAKAYRELDEDLVQASEKGWGAAAEMVKALADERGWPHHTHGALYNVVGRLRRETADDDLTLLFDHAGALHINFYENWYDREDVERRIEEVGRFVDKVETLLTGGP